MKRLTRSFLFAGKGLWHCLKNEQNFKVQIGAACVAIALALWLHCSPAEWMVIIICISMVLSLEMLNTAVERICNMVQPGIDKRIAVIKDVSAGAVLLAAVTALLCAAIIFLPKLFYFFNALN